MTTQKPLYGEKDAGCWFDGARGIYQGEAVIQEAIAHGFKPECETDRFSDSEFYHELTDEAEEFMQQFAAEGFSFGYNEHTGDWGLWGHKEEGN